MASPGSADLLAKTVAHNTKHNQSTSIPKRHSSIAKTKLRKKAPESNSATNTTTARQHNVLVRKKLPWLDGPRIPGHFDSKESLQLGDTTHSVPATVKRKQTEPEKRASLPSVGGDPALRAIGSTPSLRQRARQEELKKSLSLSSQRRPGMKPVTSKRSAEKALLALGIVDEGSKDKGCASSLYSLTTPSTEKDESPFAPPKKDASSYERLIDRRRSTNEWLQGPVNDSLSLRLQSPSPWPNMDYQVSPREKPNIPRRTESCRSCDQGLSQPSQLRSVPKAKTLPRNSISTLPIQPPQAPPPAPPTRKLTLYAMPTHLLPSSSSSSHDPVGRARRQSVQAPPTGPLPTSLPPVRTSSSRDMRRQSRALTRAVTGLENLVGEAIDVASNAAHNGRGDEVADILEHATLALRRASTARGDLTAGRMTQPLVLSPKASEKDSDSADSVAPYSDASSKRSQSHSVDTAPTLLTKSAQSSQQPILMDQRKPSNQFAGVLNRSVESVGTRDSQISRDRHSMSRTPPRLYQPPSADSIVRDFAYARVKTAKAEKARQLSKVRGTATDYYGDVGQSVGAQPGVRSSVSAPTMMDNASSGPSQAVPRPSIGAMSDIQLSRARKAKKTVRKLEPVPTMSIPPRTSSRSWEKLRDPAPEPPRQRRERYHRSHLSDLFESTYYHQKKPRDLQRENINTADPGASLQRESSSVTPDNKYVDDPNAMAKAVSKRYSDSPPLLQRHVSLKHPRRKHLSLREGQGFSLGRYHRRQPIAREWNNLRKRITATIACMNTVFVGLIAGIYAGEVPRIQYQLADTSHKVILGNVVLFACLGLTTLIFWPLPLLHGRKPYTLMAFALVLPLIFPQALVVSGYRNPHNPIFRCGLLIPRAFAGLAMGFANINFLPTLFDLFGASLMSAQPHQEIVVYDDVRRQGGGMGIWLGIWSFCFVGSMSIGFCVGACIISAMSPSWGFYITIILLAFFLLINVIAPETRRAPYRRSIAQFLDADEKVKRRVARGEVKLHISNDGPKWWFEEVWAGIILTKRMVLQPGFFILMAYLGWMYAQVTLVILLLGALLSRDYKWQPQYVGPAVLSVAIGAFLAVPLAKANLFSRARDTPARTDSMTMAVHHHTQRIHWSSHMLRRCVFTLTLPFAAIAYTLSSPGPSVSWTVPTVFCGLVGFLSNLAIAECVGLLMETFDTCDLQPGVNQKHRLQSMTETTRRRRTNYSSFPRVCAAFFAAQSLGFFLSAAATGVAGDITRALGAQMTTAIVAATLLVLTVCFIIVLWRWREVQVIPNHVFGSWQGGDVADPEWRPVVIGNPSGKMRRMNALELGRLSRWSEIRALNKLGG